MWSFRNEGAFHEALTNQVLDDLVAVTRPRYMRIIAKWYVRGGIFTDIIAQHRKRGWKPPLALDLTQLGGPVSGTASPFIR